MHHAERVAASCFGVRPEVRPSDDGAVADWPAAVSSDPDMAALRVKVVPLPGVPHGGDVVDYLDVHSVQELRALIEAAPYWTPNGAEQARLEQRRARTRERMRRFRARSRASLMTSIAWAA
jgi:hypothetical protein